VDKPERSTRDLAGDSRSDQKTTPPTALDVGDGTEIYEYLRAWSRVGKRNSIGAPDRRAVAEEAQDQARRLDTRDPLHGLAPACAGASGEVCTPAGFFSFFFLFYCLFPSSLFYLPSFFFAWHVFQTFVSFLPLLPSLLYITLIPLSNWCIS